VAIAHASGLRRTHESETSGLTASTSAWSTCDVKLSLSWYCAFRIEVNDEAKGTGKAGRVRTKLTMPASGS